MPIGAIRGDEALRAQRDSARRRADELAGELADYRRAWQLCQERIDEQDVLIARLRRAWLHCGDDREACQQALGAAIGLLDEYVGMDDETMNPLRAPLNGHEAVDT